MQRKTKLNVVLVMMLIFIGFAFQPAVPALAACPDGIFAQWKLDDEPGTPGGTYVDNIKDNDGTGNVNPTAIDGVVDGAQEFDGSTTQINVPADNSFDWQSDESFSIEFWVKTGDTAIPGSFPNNENMIVIGRNDDNLQWWVGVHKTEGKVGFFLTDSNGNGPAIGDQLLGVGDKVLTGGAWHHVVAVRDDGENLNIVYVDGVKQGEFEHDYTADFDSTADLNIGWIDIDFTDNFKLDGAIDELAIYDRALDADEIEDHYEAGVTGTDVCAGVAPFVPYPDDTISFWKLDDEPGTPGGTYADAFGDNDGTGNVNPTAIDGVVDGAQEFDGSTTQINVPADNSFDWQSDESFSIEFWVKTGDTAIPGSFPNNENMIVIGRNDDNLQWWVGVHKTEGKVGFFLTDSNGNGPAIGDQLLGVGDKVLTGGAWHHVVAVRDDGENLNIVYVDGVKQGEFEHDYTADFDSTADLNIGWIDIDFTDNFKLDGAIDELAIYDRALDADEIEDHYTVGVQGDSITSLRSAPVANAGENQTEEEGGGEVTLDGSGSADEGGGIVAWLWEQTSGTTVPLTDEDTQAATFDAPEDVDDDEILRFRLTVTDSDGLTDTDNTKVTITNSVALSEPVADAGEDDTVTEGDEVTLTGTATDSDGTIVSYQWEQRSGTSVTLTDADTATATFEAPDVDDDEILRFRLTVTDDDDQTDTDTIEITVEDDSDDSNNSSSDDDGGGGGGGCFITTALD